MRLRRPFTTLGDDGDGGGDGFDASPSKLIGLSGVLNGSPTGRERPACFEPRARSLDRLFA